MEAYTNLPTPEKANELIDLLKSKGIYACMSGSKQRGYEVLVNSGNLEEVKRILEC